MKKLPKSFRNYTIASEGDAYDIFKGYLQLIEKASGMVFVPTHILLLFTYGKNFLSLETEVIASLHLGKVIDENFLKSANIQLREWFNHVAPDGYVLGEKDGQLMFYPDPAHDIHVTIEFKDTVTKQMTFLYRGAKSLEDAKDSFETMLDKDLLRICAHTEEYPDIAVFNVDVLDYSGDPRNPKIIEIK